jgi:hypothetical protein
LQDNRRALFNEIRSCALCFDAKPMTPVIISGGQTGADRAGLDWAIAHRIPHGGCCPRGRRAEDGVIDAKYRLVEMDSSSYLERTRANATDTDATVIFTIAASLTGGSRRTAEFARTSRKPCLHLSRDRDGAAAGEMLKRFAAEHHVARLNVAGSRASKEPDVAGFVTEVMTAAFGKGA